MITVQCIDIPMPDPPPSISIPQLGIMQKAWDSLHAIPSPDELIMRFQDAISAALAPVRYFLELIEVCVSLFDCIQAIPDAVTSLSPSPIYDCLKKLAKAISRILSYIPPMAYIRTALDIASYCMAVIDEIVLFFTEIDNLLTEYIEKFTNAQLIGDVDLMNIISCSAKDINIRFTMILDILKLVKPFNDILMNVFLRTLGSGVADLKKAQTSYTQSGDYIESAGSSYRNNGTLPVYPGSSSSTKAQHILVPIPPISPLLESLNVSRNAMVLVYNLLAPVVGLDPDKEFSAIPEFTNF
jgi:hypothetical protein